MENLVNNIIFLKVKLNISFSGEWQMSVSPKGFVTRDLHLEVLKDLDNYLEDKKITRPVWLFMDGASPHISLSALDFCKQKKIQPWLFKPNMTHLVQVKITLTNLSNLLFFPLAFGSHLF